MTRIAILAAFPGELAPLVRGWSSARKGNVHLWRWRCDEGEWIAACAGAGVEAAHRAFAEAEADGPLSFVISTGWAGALTADAAAGRAYAVSGVIDARTGERFATANTTERCWLVTSPAVADEIEKHRLASTYGAALVDMEATAVARLAAQRGIPFYCFKGVSDSLTERLPDFNRFLSSNGQLRLTRLILFVLPRPAYWPGLMRMGENGKKAAGALAEALLDFLDERGNIRKRNGYPDLIR